MSELTELNLDIDDLLLDPNNYRFQDAGDFVAAEPARFHEETVQAKAFTRLREANLGTLKESIIANGFLPFERIVVRPYEHAEGKYVVVEGNRRTAALRWLRQDHLAGVNVPEGVLNACENVPVIAVEEAGADFLLSLMGVRHVGGIDEWGGYQRAKLVTELRDEFDLDVGQVANRLGMTSHEVTRRYRAYKALRQMQDDESYGDAAAATLYPVFHEAIAIPVVREWLGWDEQRSEFASEDTLEEFYKLLTRTEEDGESREPKITTYSQVRELREVIPNTEAQRILLDPSRSFSEAVAFAKSEEFAQSWTSQVAEANNALRKVSAVELSSLDAEKLAEIVELRNLVETILDLHERLNSD